MKWERGRAYKRADIVRELGGGPGYLPVADGRVVAGLFDPAENAVTHLSGAIDVFPKVLSQGAKILKPEALLPVFLKFNTEDWRYMGVYRLAKLEKGARALEQARKEIGREDIAVVLRFEPAK